MWAKNNVKVSQDTGPFLLQNIKNNFVDNGWKEKKKKKRHKRSYRVNQRHGYHEDNFQLSSSIPADFILVVVGVQEIKFLLQFIDREKAYVCMYYRGVGV